MKSTPPEQGSGLDGLHRAAVTLPSAMALTPAQKQKRYRERLEAAEQANADAIERALLQEVERCERGETSDRERIALAEKLADLARDLLWRAHSLSKMA